MEDAAIAFSAVHTVGVQTAFAAVLEDRGSPGTDCACTARSTVLTPPTDLPTIIEPHRQPGEVAAPPPRKRQGRAHDRRPVQHPVQRGIDPRNPGDHCPLGDSHCRSFGHMDSMPVEIPHVLEVDISIS
jgi:hypothetical protein